MPEGSSRRQEWPVWHPKGLLGGAPRDWQACAAGNPRNGGEGGFELSTSPAACRLCGVRQATELSEPQLPACQ